MMFKRYKNELIVAFSVCCCFWLLLHTKVRLFLPLLQSIFHGKTGSLVNLKSCLFLKKDGWTKKRLRRVDKLEKLVPASKVLWKKKGKKLTVSYKGLTPKELNKVITSILNLAVQIQVLEIINSNGSYIVEFKCKW